MLDPIVLLTEHRKQFNPMRGGKNAKAHHIIQSAIEYLKRNPYYLVIAQDTFALYKGTEIRARELECKGEE